MTMPGPWLAFVASAEIAAVGSGRSDAIALTAKHDRCSGNVQIVPKRARASLALSPSPSPMALAVAAHA